jgi:endoglycosylceramidase
MVDTGGRVVVIHGVNMPSKSLPAYPAALGFDDDDAVFLASEGFNAVRLTVERYVVEPQPGRFDDAYITQIAHTVDTLASHGIVSLIDFHQDEYGPVFFDNGFPAWMTVTDSLPNLFEVGFPAQYVANPALNRAFDHFWANDPDTTGNNRLQADDGAILAHVAAGLRDKPTVLGYEILNEPWPGSQYPACFVAATGCPTFDEGPVSAYYAYMAAAIRAADPTHLVWFEPLVTFNYGIPTSVVAPQGPNLGFAFHDYPACSPADDARLPASFGGACGTEEATTIDHAQAYVAQTGTALLETEFGATKNPATIATAVARYDAAMVPWMFWSYTNYIDNLRPDGSLLPPSGTNINGGILDALVRPYPQVVSGTPLSYQYDPQAKRFALRYSTKGATGRDFAGSSDPTEIFVPRRFFGGSYRVRASGAEVVPGGDSQLVELRSCAWARTVGVTVTNESPVAGPGCKLPVATLSGKRLFIRLRCPRSARARKCRIRAVAVTRRKRGRRMTRTATARLKRGKSKLVALRIRSRYLVALSAKKTVLVRERVRANGKTRTIYKRFKVRRR